MAAIESMEVIAIGESKTDTSGDLPPADVPMKETEQKGPQTVLTSECLREEDILQKPQLIKKEVEDDENMQKEGEDFEEISNKEENGKPEIVSEMDLDISSDKGGGKTLSEMEINSRKVEMEEGGEDESKEGEEKPETIPEKNSQPCTETETVEEQKNMNDSIPIRMEDCEVPGSLVEKNEKEETGAPAEGTECVLEKKRDEEDVCFICYDGGELVVCDRRACPKSYHPECIDRAPEFFVGRGNWSCDWHFCRECKKPASMQCMTCWQAHCRTHFTVEGKDWLRCGRGKGICDDCLPLIKMLEQFGSVGPNGEVIDFNDPETVENFFKEYYENYHQKKIGPIIRKLRTAKAREQVEEAVAGGETEEELEVEVKDGPAGTRKRGRGKGKGGKKIGKGRGEPVGSARGKLVDEIEFQGGKGKQDKKRPRLSQKTQVVEQDETSSEENLDLGWEEKKEQEETEEEKKEVDTEEEDEKREQEEEEDEEVDEEDEDLEDEPEEIEEDEDEVDELDSEKRSPVKPKIFDGWASDELMKFLGDRGLDVSARLPWQTVIKTMWAYINGNGLKDPHRKNVVRCDASLENLVGTSFVSPMKLVSILSTHYRKTRASSRRRGQQQTAKNDSGFHNLWKEKGGRGLTEEANEDSYGGQSKGDTSALKISGSRGKKTKGLYGNRQRSDPNDFACIDKKTIGLIYLTRGLLENLLDDPDFDGKVVNSYVRIRIPAVNHHTDICYRLVRIVGVSSEAESYQVGVKTTNKVLHIVNTRKAEPVTIENVSSQPFTEEECRNLRKYMKWGIIPRLTVGEIEQKALELRGPKLIERFFGSTTRLSGPVIGWKCEWLLKAQGENNLWQWFELERQKLVNLRDRASERGAKKELRVTMERLKELESPEFRMAKMESSIEVEADPEMATISISDDEEENEGEAEEELPGESARTFQGVHTGGRFSGDDFASRRPKTGGWGRSDSWENRDYGDVRKGRERERETSHWGDQGHRNSWTLIGKEDTYGIHRPENLNDSGIVGRSEGDGWGERRAPSRPSILEGGGGTGGTGGRGKDTSLDNRSLRTTTPYLDVRETGGLWTDPGRPAVPPTIHGTLAVGIPSLVSPVVNEEEETWFYQDPQRVVQGPFSLSQLRDWFEGDLLPADLKIWRTGQTKDVHGIEIKIACEKRPTSNLNSTVIPPTPPPPPPPPPVMNGGEIMGGRESGKGGYNVGVSQKGPMVSSTGTWETADSIQTGTLYGGYCREKDPATGGWNGVRASETERFGGGAVFSNTPGNGWRDGGKLESHNGWDAKRRTGGDLWNSETGGWEKDEKAGQDVARWESSRNGGSGGWDGQGEDGGWGGREAGRSSERGGSNGSRAWRSPEKRGNGVSDGSGHKSYERWRDDGDRRKDRGEKGQHKSNKPCRYMAQFGRCRNGNKCSFKHD